MSQEPVTLALATGRGKRKRQPKLGQTAAQFLKALSIEYRKVDGQTFWEANREHLSALFKDCVREVRGVMRETHPDVGGDEGAFRRFIARWQAVRRSFDWYVPKIEAPVSPTLKVRLVKNPKRALQKKRWRERDLEGYRAKQRARYQRLKAEGRLPKQKKRYCVSPASIAREREASRRWKIKNPEKVRAARRASYHRNKATAQRYRLEHREERLRDSRNNHRRHRERNNARRREAYRRKKNGEKNAEFEQRFAAAHGNQRPVIPGNVEAAAC